MASSSAGSSRSSSSNRKVERTLSDSTFGNMMLSLKAPIATSRDKGKRKATVVQDDADDVIVVELGGARQTSSSKSRPSRASSSVAAATSIATSRSTRPTQPAASEASSSTLVAPKNTQRKRKAEPGDGFKMNFKHSQAVIQPTSTSRNSSSSYRDPTRPSKPRPTAPPPSASSFASSSRSHQSSTKPSFTTADAPPTQSESSFTSILPSALAGSTQGKPKLRPLQAFRPPPSFTIRSTSPLSSPPTVKAAAQPPPPPRPSPPLLSAAAVDPRQRSASPPPTPPKAPSPRKRKRTPLQLRSPTIDRTLSTTDWAELHPSLETSHLFRLEYALHGGLTYNQTRTALKKEQFTKVTRKSVPAAAVVLHDEPSWIDDEVAVGTLKKELGDKEHFVAVVWARDVLGRNKMEEGSVGEEGELRKAVIGGVDMYLLGKEFPLKLVIFVGMIVGISEKDTIISYEVDDGTGVITCTCALRQREPIFVLPPRKTDDSLAESRPRTPSPRKRKVEALVEAGEDRLEVGTLVKVVGRVEEHSWVATADRRIVAEKMEALYDANLETEHHLQVARLHREVYNKPLDLQARLAQIKQAEAEQWSHLTSSQASSSNAGTPTKRIRLSRPIKLHDDDITPQNFVTYIRQHLRDRHVDRPSPPRGQPSSMPDSDGAFWELKFASQDCVEEPTLFTLDDIESDRQLVTFATRLAQKGEREKRAKRKVGALGREKGKLWVSKEGKEGVFSVKGVGSHGGSSLLLRTVSSELRSSKGREKSTSKEEEQPLQGVKLEKAISKCFREALIEMRKKGVIVLSEPEIEESRWAADSRTMDDSRYLPDAPSYALPSRNSDCYPAHGGAWPVLFAEEEEEEERRPSPRSSKQSNGPPDPSAKSWDASTDAWDVILEDSVEEEKGSLIFAPSNSTGKKFGHAQWDIILEDDPDDQASTMLETTSNDRHTPRSTRTRSKPDLPSCPSTVKPTRTTNLNSQAQSTSLRPSYQSSHIPSSPPTFEIPRLFQSPRNDRTFATDSSWTTSIAGVHQETYELVTHTSLGPPVLRVLRNIWSGQTFGSKHKGGVSERGIREALVRDERWAGVASYSDLVGKALTVLEEQGEVQSVGSGEWKPMKGLGFTKGTN